MSAFVQLFTKVILQLTQSLGNMGLAIIVFTVVLRLLLTPLSIMGLRSAKKMQEVQPELQKLQKKYKKDPKRLQQEQMALYKKNGVNPMAGCLPQLVQIGLLILLYQAFMQFLKLPELVDMNTTFLWMDLLEPDSTYVLAILAAGTQFLLSLMSLPRPKPEELAQKKLERASGSSKSSEKEQPDFASTLTSSLQTQMVYVFPIITGVIAIKFPSGLVLYWVVSTIISMIQQYYVGGWGKLGWYVEQLKARALQKK